jgi:hypothetical protein
MICFSLSPLFGASNHKKTYMIQKRFINSARVFFASF